MESYWQSVSVIVLVGLAVVYLVVKQIRGRKVKPACSGCPAVKGVERDRTERSFTL